MNYDEREGGVHVRMTDDEISRINDTQLEICCFPASGSGRASH